MMRQTLSTYPYLVFCLGGLGILGVLLALCPSQRKPAMWSGLLGTPFGLASVLMVPTYWEPRWVWSVGQVGVEDLIFSFVFAAWAWLLATIGWRHQVVVRIYPRRVFVGYVVCVVCGLTVFGVAWPFVRDPMTAALLGFAAGMGVHLFLRPDLWRLALSGTLGFGLLYSLYVKLLFQQLPAFATAWPASGRWNMPFLGIPQGEIVWALAYGACWPLFLAFLFQAEIKKGLK